MVEALLRPEPPSHEPRSCQILKQFTSGGNKSGGSKTQLISMAMAEASKLFDKSGGAASGNKQDAVNGAAMTVMKLMVQSKFSGAVGGSNSGGLGSLMGMVFMFRLSRERPCSHLIYNSRLRTSCNETKRQPVKAQVRLVPGPVKVWLFYIVRISTLGDRPSLVLYNV